MKHAIDASTCKSILLRRGPGGMKHLDTNQLWVQEAITEKRFRVQTHWRRTQVVKSTSPVTENHYKNGYEKCTTST